MCLRKTLAGEYHDYRNVIVFEKIHVLTKMQSQRFLNSSALKSVFEKLCFREGLVWMVGLPGERKLGFQIPPA